MSEHTPGPWEINPFKAQVDAFVGAEPLAVCQMLWPTDLRSEDETEANARLIAAAPDLLEALRGCLALIGDQFADPRAEALDGHPIAAEARKQWDKGWDAIAKAEGQAERSEGGSTPTLHHETGSLIK